MPGLREGAPAGPFAPLLSRRPVLATVAPEVSWCRGNYPGLGYRSSFFPGATFPLPVWGHLWGTSASWKFTQGPSSGLTGGPWSVPWFVQYAPDSWGELLFWLPFVGDHQEVSPLASIERRQGKNGVSYKVRYRLPPGEDGNRKWETKTFRRKKDAALFRAEIDRSIYRGDFAEESRITVRELFDRVMMDHVEVRLAERTVLDYRYAFNHRILPAFGNLRITKVRRENAQQFYRDLVDGGLGVPAAKKTVRRLSTVLNLAVEWELLARESH